MNRAIEGPLPVTFINDAAAYEKSVKVGKPTSVHHWWARRPLVAARAAVLCSVLPALTKDDSNTERADLLTSALSSWNVPNDRETIIALQKQIASEAGSRLTTVVDPFSGGGAIPFEALRLGFRVIAGDLNPVAVLINKALLEFPVRFKDLPSVHPRAERLVVARGTAGLVQDIRLYAADVLEAITPALRVLYPSCEVAGRTYETVAWIWARTANCPNPACHAETPLVRSFALSSKRNHEYAIDVALDSAANAPVFSVKRGKPSRAGTVSRKGAVCIKCDQPISLAYLRAEGCGSRLGARLMATVADTSAGRLYLDPDRNYESAVKSLAPMVDLGVALPQSALGFRVQAYGLRTFNDLFTAKQLTALDTLADAIKATHARIVADGATAATGRSSTPGVQDGDFKAYADAVTAYLALALSRCADWNSSLSRWENKAEVPQQVFGRQTLSMVWDFVEANVLSQSTGSFAASIANVTRSLVAISPVAECAVAVPVVEQIDAAALLAKVSDVLICTDPPYYDNIGYAHLSDFFYLWLRRALAPHFPILFSTVLTPKALEMIAEPARADNDMEKAKAFFEKRFRETLARAVIAQNPQFPCVIFYAFKQSEDDENDAGDADRRVASSGWETMLQAVIDSGFQVTATVPLRTEMASRMRGQNSNALASSVLIACRARSPVARIATRREFIADLKNELGPAMREFQNSAIAAVDLAQAAIGPGMAIFSRFSRIIEADGSAMPVRSALQLINQGLEAILTEQDAEFDAETQWAIAWFSDFGMSDGPFGIAETLSKAKNTSVETMANAEIVKAAKGRVRLLARENFDTEWDPGTVDRLIVWLLAQHLIRRLQLSGEQAAADVLRKVGGIGETARDLAYRLYSVCERKGWAEEGMAYNALVVAWPEISRLSSERSALDSAQMRLK